jgi:DNA polymerase-3 subunit epsilon
VILIYDTETTGLPSKAPLGDPSQPRLVQLGALFMEPDGTERMRLDLVIYRDEIPEAAQRAHGITEGFAKTYGVNEGAALDIFLDLVEVSDTIVAHNLRYDELVIKNALAVQGEQNPDPFRNKNKFDTMLVSTNICKLPKRNGGYKYPTLMEAHKHFFGVGFEGAHQAISDVLACKRIFFHLQSLAAGNTPTQPE